MILFHCKSYFFSLLKTMCHLLCIKIVPNGSEAKLFLMTEEWSCMRPGLRFNGAQMIFTRAQQPRCLYLPNNFWQSFLLHFGVRQAQFGTLMIESPVNFESVITTGRYCTKSGLSTAAFPGAHSDLPCKLYSKIWKQPWRFQSCDIRDDGSQV